MDVPAESTQINVRVSWVAGLAVWQIDSACPAEDADRCPVLSGGRDPLAAPLSSTVQIGGGRVAGPRARFVVKNTLPEGPLAFWITIEPYRAGCT